MRRRAQAFPTTAMMIVAGGLMLATCSSPGDSCRSDSDCGGELVCAKPEVDGGTAETGACTHKAAGPGERCRAADDCAGGLFCSNELPAPFKQLDGACIPRRDEGQPCATADQCTPPLECLLTGEEGGTCGAAISDGGPPQST